MNDYQKEGVRRMLDAGEILPEEANWILGKKPKDPCAGNDLEEEC